jgi:hypothetical protein
MTGARTQERRRYRLRRNVLVEVTAVAEPKREVVELGPDEVLEYAWAGHQRVFPAPGRSFLRAVSGTAVGAAGVLMAERRRARATSELEDFLEALQLRGRVIAEVRVPEFRRVHIEPDHDCDCTCAGLEGHLQWTVGAPVWTASAPGKLLTRLASGERVLARLGSGEALSHCLGGVAPNVRAPESVRPRDR